MKISPQVSARIAVASAVLLGSARGCSRVLQNKYDTIVAGRSMDWGFSFEDVLFLNPPGQEMDGRGGDLSVEWTSKYGSVVSSTIGYFSGLGEKAKEEGTKEGCTDMTFEKDGASDGMNSEGLSVHMLYLGEEDGTVYAEPSTTDPVNLSYMRWVRYVLDNFSTVAEAVEGLQKVVTVKDAVCKGVPLTDGHGKMFGLHLAMEDPTGDSAVIEHTGGTWDIYHDRDNTLVMTNEPPYNEQKEYLAKYEPWGGNLTLPENLPGSVGSPERMVRLEYYLQYTPEPASKNEAIANIRSLIASSNVPFGAPYDGGIYPTWWESFTDNTDKVYLFNWLLTPNVVWLEMDDIDWESLPGVLKLHPQDDELSGNVLCDFETLDGEDPKLEQCSEATASEGSNGLRGVAVE